MQKIRNTCARLGIMRKGGAHGQTPKAKRRDEKAALKKNIKKGSYCEPFYVYFQNTIDKTIIISL